MEKSFQLYPFSEEFIYSCVDLFIQVFSNEPWNEIYHSKKQVIDFFKNHISNNYFMGYVLKTKEEIIALSVGMKKPWLNGMEYYIDQFCVKTSMQGLGIGSQFLKLILKDIKQKGINAIILNTEKGFPSERFYLKNGFRAFSELIVLTKTV